MPSGPPRYRIRDANLDVRPDLGCLVRGDEEIVLRPETFQTLLLLLEQRHRVVSKDEIAEQISPGAAVTDDAVVQCLVEIRQVLGEDPKHAKFIRTFAKSGYQFIGIVQLPETLAAIAARAKSAQSAETPAQAPTQPVEVTAPPPRSHALTVAVIVAITAFAMTLVFVIYNASRHDEAGGLRDRLAARPAERPRVAVMLLENQSNTPELEWLRKDLADKLVTGLSRSKGLSVRAVDVADWGKFDHVVIGSFAKLGSGIAIDLGLHDRTGQLVKTEALTIDSLDDLVKSVDGLSARLVRDLVETYSRLGSALAGERRYDEAIQSFERGLGVDPDSADLWDRMGGVYGEMGRPQDSINARQEFVALQPNEAHAFDSLGLSLQNAGRYDEAVTAYRQALELDVRFNVATLHLGNTYVQSGRYNEAMNAYRQYAKQGTPDVEGKRGLQDMAIVELLRGRLQDALALVRQADVGQPMTIIEARIRLAMGEPADRISSLVQPPTSPPSERAWRDMQGQFALKSSAVDEAIQHFRAGVAARPIGTDSEPLEDILANAYVQLGRYDEAIAEYDRILKLNPRYPLVHYHLGLAYEGKHQSALARQSYEQFLSIWAKADADIPEVVKARQRVAALQ